MSFRLNKTTCIVVAVLLVNGVLIALATNRLFGRSETITESPVYRYGINVPEELAQRLRAGFPHDFAGNQMFLLLGDNVEPTAIDYLEALVNRHGTEQLAVRLVHRSTQALEIWRRAHRDVRLPSIVDEGLDLHRFVKVDPTHLHGALVVLKKGSALDFRAYPVPPEDELRQLFQKYSTGEIEYSYVAPQLKELFVRGELIRPLDVERLSNGQHTRLTAPDVANAVVVVFAASCASCQLTGFIDEVRALTRRAVGSDKRIIVVFASSFRQVALAAYQFDGSLPADAFIVRGNELRTLDRVSDADLVPLLVATEADGRIATVQPLRLE